jgi:hypothetical protein
MAIIAIITDTIAVTTVTIGTPTGIIAIAGRRRAGFTPIMGGES